VDAIEISGRLDVTALAAALDEVLRRREPLRTTFVDSGGVQIECRPDPRRRHGESDGAGRGLPQGDDPERMYQWYE
jgi:hypothetical protein